MNANLTLLRQHFTEAWKLPAAHCTLLGDPPLPRDVSRAVQQAGEAATDTLLVYYAGHGLIEPRTGKLHLAVEATDPTSVHDTAIPYDWIRWPVEKSRALRRIVVLDSCYSARAFGVQSATAALEVDGTYLLAAAAETAVALSPPGEPLTAFTSEWLTLMEQGVPGEGEFLDLDTIFTRLRTRLVTSNRPEPHRLCRNQLGQVPFIRNTAYIPPPTPLASASVDWAARTDRVDRVIAELSTGRSLADTLQAVVDGALVGLGFGLAAVNLVRPDGDLVLAALAGDPAIETRITGRTGSRKAWDRRLSLGSDWNGVRYVPYSAGPPPADDIPEWHDEQTASDHEGTWHPEDRLYAPMYSGLGELLGVIALDRPQDCNVPDVDSIGNVRKYAFHSAVAITQARLRANMQRALIKLEREQQALRASEESFREAFEYAPSGMAIAEMGGDQHGRMLRVNDFLCRLLGRPASALRRYALSDLVHPDDIPTVFGISAEGGRAELRLARRDGRYVWVSMRNSIVADSADGPRFLLTHVEDIEERKQHDFALLRRASVDDLTDLLTESELRSLLDQRLCGGVSVESKRSTASPGSADTPNRGPAQVHRHKRLPTQGQPTLALLRFGLDDFKAYNTAHGRAAGDGALREIAARLRVGLTEWGGEHAIGRARGDEFVVLAPDLDMQKARALADRLHKICRLPLTQERVSSRWTPTMTGVVYWATCGRSGGDALGESGDLLHRSKISRPAAPGH